MSPDIALAVAAGLFFALYQILNRLAGLRLRLARLMVTLLSASVVTAAVLTFAVVGGPRLWNLTLRGVLLFAGAGFFHFVLGFTFISLSQQRVGAGRTGALVGTVPIFAAIVGWFVLGEGMTPTDIGAIALVVAGATLISTEQIAGGTKGGTPFFGIGAAASFSVSAAFIRTGLQTGAPPLVGLLVGFLTSLASYVIVSVVDRARGGAGAGATPGPAGAGVTASAAPAVDATPVRGRAYTLQIAAGITIAFAMWFRYVATATVPIAVVTALGRVNIPVILVLSPLVLHTPIDATSPRLWGGALAVIGGTMMLAFI